MAESGVALASTRRLSKSERQSVKAFALSAGSKDAKFFAPLIVVDGEDASVVLTTKTFARSS